MNVLVTGAAGFVGSHLTPLLEARGDEVTGLALQETEGWLGVDLRDAAAVEEVVATTKPRAIVHLAAQSSTAASWRDPAFTYESNVTGTHHLLAAAQRHVPECRVLISGTSDGYGIVKAEDCPLTEEAALRPVSPYAASKVAQEAVGRMFFEAYGLGVVVARAFMHVGPGQAPSFATARWARQIARIEHGLQEPMLTVGNIHVQREFCDVRDVIAAYLALLEKGAAGEAYNVATGAARPLADALEMFLSRSTADIEVRVDQDLIRPADPPILAGDPTKLMEATGWVPTHRLDDTLAEVLDYWRERVAAEGEQA